MSRYSVQQCRDSETGRFRWAVMHAQTRVFYFANRYGKAAAKALCVRLNKGAA